MVAIYKTINDKRKFISLRYDMQRWSKITCNKNHESNAKSDQFQQK